MKLSVEWICNRIWMDYEFSWFPKKKFTELKSDLQMGLQQAIKSL